MRSAVPISAPIISEPIMTAVITEGPDPLFRPIDGNAHCAEIRDQYDLPADVPLILYVGGLSPHKNIQGLLHSLARLEQQPWHLVLVGDYANDSFLGCYRELVDLAEGLGLAGRVTFTGYVSDDQLLIRQR